MLAGVCAGIAARYDLDVTLVRIIAVVLALASGLGVAAYVAGWLLTPSTDAPAPLHRDSTAARRVSEQGRHLAGRIPAIVLIVLAGLAAAALLHIRWVGVPFGLVVVLLAVALVVGSRVGRWLLASVAALLVLALAFFGILGPHLGSRSFRVSSTQDLRTSYDYAAAHPDPRRSRRRDGHRTHRRAGRRSCPDRTRVGDRRRTARHRLRRSGDPLARHRFDVTGPAGDRRTGRRRVGERPLSVTFGRVSASARWTTPQ
jgi:phage shock protein PspC (stress-responsive transcriptional regulator)